MAITVEAVHRKVQYTSSGSAGPYAFSFKVLAATDIKVSVNDTLKTVTTHYTTAYSADGTGSVTFTSGNEPASDTLVTIESDQAIARTTDYSTGGDFTASSINDALDRLTINDQQIETELSRNIQLASTTKRTTSGTGTSGPLVFPYDATVSNNASKLIAFDSNGTALETTTGRVSSVSVSAVSAGGSPTVSFNDSTGALALGVVTGNTGATGSTGSTGSSGSDGSDGSDGVGGLLYTFSTTTSDADPGAGKIRLNHGTIGSATAAFIDDSSAASGNPDVSAFLLTWDDSTQTSDRGQVTIVKKAAQQNFATFKISGASTDASGYVKLALTHVASNGSFSNDDAVLVSFVRTGNAGSLDDPMSTRGDIIVRNSSNATARLAVGSANTVLKSDGTDVSYGTVSTAMIADDAVTLAKLAAGTDGELLTWDASGNPTTVGAGSSGHFLKSQGAGSVPVFAAVPASGAMTLIDTEAPSAGASAITLTGIDATYATYFFKGDDLFGSETESIPYLRLGDSSGVDSGGSDYAWSCEDEGMKATAAGTSATAPVFNRDNADAQIEMCGDSLEVGEQTGEGCHFIGWLHGARATKSYPILHGLLSYNNHSSTLPTQTRFNGARLTNLTTTSITFLFNTGTIQGGRFSLFGIKNA